MAVAVPSRAHTLAAMPVVGPRIAAGHASGGHGRLVESDASSSHRVAMTSPPCQVEVFFDFSSPWTYLALSQLRNLEARHPGATFIYRPILVSSDVRNGSMCEFARVRYVKTRLLYMYMRACNWLSLAWVTT